MNDPRTNLPIDQRKVLSRSLFNGTVEVTYIDPPLETPESPQGGPGSPKISRADPKTPSGEPPSGAGAPLIPDDQPGLKWLIYDDDRRPPS